MLKTIRDSILILLFEFIGTTLLCCLYNVALRHWDYCGFLMGTYVILILGAKISGSHYNPAITVAFMFRKDVGRFSRVLGLAYIIFQFCGAFCGALLAFWFNGEVGFLGLPGNSASFIPATIIAESLGTLLLTFLYLTQTEAKTKLSQDPAITTLIIASTYFAAILMVGATDNYGFGCLNPAIAMATCLVMSFGGQPEGMKWFWIYLAFPFLGAILGIIFHELLYKNMQDSVEEVEDKDDGILDKVAETHEDDE